MSEKKIPYKIYLEESEMPKEWYNVRADMKKKPSPLLNPETHEVMSAEELSAVLSQVDTKLEIPIEHPNLNVIKIVKSIAVFVIVWLPFVLVLGGFVHDMTFYAYPKINTKNVLLTKMSNYLCSPLHSIVGFSQAMLEGLSGEMNDKQTKY